MSKIEFENSETPQSLLDGLKQQDDQAWERFVEIVGTVMYARCRASGLIDVDAADLVQETFIKVRGGIDDFTRHGTGSFRGWLNRIRKNAVIDFTRKRARTFQASGDSDIRDQLNNYADDIDEQTSLSPVDPDYVLIVRQALKVIESDFQPRAIQAFQMMNIDDLTAAEVAEKLGMTANAVRQAAYRVRQRLREMLHGLLD